MKPYAQYKTDGSLWKAGHTVFGLCSAYNHATDPGAYMGDSEHKRSFVYARAIKNRIRKLGFKTIELSDGRLWPVKQ